MSSSDSEFEETEYIVYADFKNQLAPHQLKHEDAAIKIIGIESDTPMAEINGNIFKGTYDLVMGTNVFFEKDQNSVPSDTLFESICRQRYKYMNKSNKVINFKRVYVEKLPKDAQSLDKSNETPLNKNNQQTFKLNLNYKEAIRKFIDEN